MIVQRVTTEHQRRQAEELWYSIFVQELGHRDRSADRKRLPALKPGWSEILIAVDEGELVGAVEIQILERAFTSEQQIDQLGISPFAQSFGLKPLVAIDKLAIHPKRRKSMTAVNLTIAAYLWAVESHQAEFIFASCPPHLVPFYTHMGFRRHGPGFMDLVRGFNVPLVLVTGDVDHLAQINSPLSVMAPSQNQSPAPSAFFTATFPDYARSPRARSGADNAYWQSLATQFHRNPTKDIPLLDGLSEQEVEEITEVGSLLNVEPGTHLVEEGSLGEELYLILTGAVEVCQKSLSGRHTIPLNILGAGDSFGEMAMLRGEERTATVTATVPSRILQVDPVSFRNLITTSPTAAAKLAFNLSRVLADRLAQTSQNLTAALSGEKWELDPRVFQLDDPNANP